MTRQYSYWTQKDVLLLKQMMNAGLTVREMAIRFGSTDDRVRDRIKQDAKRPQDKKMNAVRAKAWREKQKAAGKNPKWPVSEGARRETVISAARPTPEMIADAARRASAPRSLISMLMNDPPKGCSALDRRQGA